MALGHSVLGGPGKGAFVAVISPSCGCPRCLDGPASQKLPVCSAALGPTGTCPLPYLEAWGCCLARTKPSYSQRVSAKVPSLLQW